jgi:hypothetical protein
MEKEKPAGVQSFHRRASRKRFIGGLPSAPKIEYRSRREIQENLSYSDEIFS